MSNQGVTNILSEQLLVKFTQILSKASGMKTMCIGDHNPVSRKSCEMITAAYDTVHKFRFIEKSKPVVIIPLQRRKFNNTQTWESSMCALSNHKLVDYVVDIQSCSIIDVVDRIKPDFIFISRELPEALQIENFAKKLRIKLIRV